jgi:hypothetical protein
MVDLAIARSVLGRAITVVWTGMPLTSTVGDDDHGLDLVTPRMHCHRLIDGGTGGVCGGVQGRSPASASTLIDHDELTVATGTPPLCRATWLRFSASGAPALEPLSPKHTGKKPSAL